MSSLSNQLCCCEYYDRDGDRNHLLACCCNCTDLDEICESFITCGKISNVNKRGFIGTMNDRLRIPWRGGAKQVTVGAIMPAIVIPVTILLSSFSAYITFSLGTSVLIAICYLLYDLPKNFPNTKFFASWTICTIIIQYFIFQIVVVPFLEILVEENIALGFLICGFIIFTYYMRKKSANLYNNESSLIMKEDTSRNIQCNICQIQVPAWEFHSYWYDCCVGSHNVCFYIVAQIFGLAALLYSANLTLTSVCRPFTIYKTVLLPDDCSDVYQGIEFAISFVSGVYSLVLSVFVFISFLLQLFLVTIGVTWTEWQEIPFRQKIFFCKAKRPNSKGCFHNLFRTCVNSIKS